MAENNLYKIGITHGDVNGVGYEMIMKSLFDNKILDICIPVVFGFAKVSSYHRKLMNMNDFSFQFIKQIEQYSQKKSNLLNLADREVNVEIGKFTDTSGAMALLSLHHTCENLKTKKIDAMVMAPMHVDSLKKDNFQKYADIIKSYGIKPLTTLENYFIDNECYMSQWFNEKESLSMVVYEDIKFAFATDHISQSQVPEILTTELILKKLRILHKTLINDFASTNPTIAILALNPDENQKIIEKDVILPAINQAFDENIKVFGPFPSDQFFDSGHFKQFNAVLALYHDQGMIPFELLSNGEGVKYTAGLPAVCTSPKQDPQYELAGKNSLSGQSMRNALYLAVDIIRNRKKMENPAG